MAIPDFKCSLRGSTVVTPVTASFNNCKLHVRGINMSGEQCSTDWMMVNPKGTMCALTL